MFPFCTKNLMSFIFTLVGMSLCFVHEREFECADRKRTCGVLNFLSDSNKLVSLPVVYDKIAVDCEASIKEEIKTTIIKRLGLSEVPKNFNVRNISKHHFVFDEFLNSYDVLNVDEPHFIALFPTKVNNSGQSYVMEFELHHLPEYLKKDDVLSVEIIFYDEVQNASNSLYVPVEGVADDYSIKYFLLTTNCYRRLGSFLISKRFLTWDIRSTRYIYKLEILCAENCGGGSITISTKETKIPYIKITLKSGCPNRDYPIISDKWNNSGPCSKELVDINLMAIDWGDWLAFPKFYTHAYCVGSCNVANEIDRSCKPHDTLPAFFMHWEKHVLIGREIPDMLAATCGCM